MSVKKFDEITEFLRSKADLCFSAEELTTELGFEVTDALMMKCMNLHRVTAGTERGGDGIIIYYTFQWNLEVVK